MNGDGRPAKDAHHNDSAAKPVTEHGTSPRTVVLLDRVATAATLGVPVGRLTYWHRLGLLPKPVRLDGRLLWRLSDLAEWTVDG